jgi:L-ascorbate metabolism protein UlaG (beta-lactamase superfamily)
MKIRWHGHACFEIGDGITIVTDPHDGKSIGIKPPVVKADIVLQSHDHFDHNCVRVVKKLNTKVVKTAGLTNKNDIKIKGVHSFHDDAGGDKRGENIIFRFSVDDINFCHLGDLGHPLDNSSVEELGDVDILFIPVGDVFTIGPKEAWEVINKIKPKVAVPMHYRMGGLSLSIKPLDPFLNQEKDKNVVRIGNEIQLENEDLPENFEIWVFTP